VENAFKELQQQLNSAFARQAQQIALAINKNDRDFAGLASKIEGVESGSELRAFQKGYDPSRRGSAVGGLVKFSEF